MTTSCYPKWKGKMLMDSRETEWYASMLQVLGREKGQQLMRGLAKQNLFFQSRANSHHAGFGLRRSAPGSEQLRSSGAIGKKTRRAG